MKMKMPEILSSVCFFTKVNLILVLSAFSMFTYSCRFILTTGDFLCDRDTKRIPISNLCKGNQTSYCKDRTDISFCLCDRTQWSCMDQSMCIYPEAVCNKRSETTEHIDCPDLSDENPVMCQNAWTCTEGYILIVGEAATVSYCFGFC